MRMIAEHLEKDWAARSHPRGHVARHKVAGGAVFSFQLCAVYCPTCQGSGMVGDPHLRAICSDCLP